MRKLIALANAMLEEADAQDSELRAREHKAFETMSVAELKAHFSEPPGYISSRERRGWMIRDLELSPEIPPLRRAH